MIVEFYEKPGCINNTRQKALLESYGHIVNAHSLLSEPWTKSKLRLFFGEMPVKDWFNKAAPRIKGGEVNPMDFNEDTALKAMLADPLLIRRPLIEVEGQFVCGFDNEVITELLVNADVSHLQGCPNISGNNSCD
jgi:nitrogenase-associated protein